MRTLIHTYPGGAKKYSVEPDTHCTTPDGQHEYAPENGAAFGENGNCCANCGAFYGVEIEEVGHENHL